MSDPVMMALADAAFYTATLAEQGMLLLAVTTNFKINFLRKPPADCDRFAHCQLLKLERSMALGEVRLYLGYAEQPVAHATATYAL